MKPTPVRRILWVIAILVLLGLLMAGLARAQPVHIRDDRGREVSLPRPPQRIVSLLPSCAAGQVVACAPAKALTSRWIVGK